MSRIRTNLITNRMANGAPTVSHGLVVAGVTTITGSINNLNLTGITTISTLDLNGDLDVDGHLNADNVSIAGVVTATTFYGSGANLTGIDATKIITGNTQVQTIDTGSDGHVKVITEGSEKLRIDVNGTITNTTNSSHSQGAGTFNVTGTINQYSQGSGSGLIFDCDFGRLTGYADNASIGNGTDLSAALLHTTTDWTSSSSNTPMTVNGSSFGYRVGFGGYLDCVIHQGRVSIGAGSGSPNMAEKLNTASMTIESWVWYDGAGREIIA